MFVCFILFFKEHMRKVRRQGIAKVVFLANQVALANQQADACSVHLKKYFTKVISGDTQRSKGECLKDFVNTYEFAPLKPISTV